jgi:ubiquinone/menaquinone biosynthesis C-methylase UbiE
MRINHMPASNYFGQAINAERYLRARPDIHSTAVGKFRSFAHVDAPFARALDVGCGTGQSTVALTEVASSVIGVDPSTAMLAHAIRHPNVEYQQSTAEHIPLAGCQFDLITAAQAFHWFDQDAFLAESNRLLRLPGWLVIYTSWFTGTMKEDSTFSDWFKGDYLGRYPTPPRNRTFVTEEMGQAHGFAFRGEDEFSDNLSMTLERFIDYQLSTTNIIAAVERRDTAYEDAQTWMQASIASYFGEQAQRTFLFSGRIWYLEKTTP